MMLEPIDRVRCERVLEAVGYGNGRDVAVAMDIVVVVVVVAVVMKDVVDYGMVRSLLACKYHQYHPCHDTHPH